MEFYASHMNMKGDSSKDAIENIIKKIKDKGNIFNGFNGYGSRQGMNFEELIVTQDKDGAAVAVSGTHTHQLLRSASMWSLGLEEGHEERSIHRAYV